MTVAEAYSYLMDAVAVAYPQQAVASEVKAWAVMLALAAHSEGCQTCLPSVAEEDLSPEGIAYLETRRRGCTGRARIVALGGSDDHS